MIDYSVSSGKALLGGSIRLPYNSDVDFDEFDQDSNFPIHWTTQASPLSYLVMSYFEDVNYDAADKTVQIACSKRTYTINKSIWNELDDIMDWEIGLFGINYKKQGTSNIAVAYVNDFTSDYYDKSLNSVKKNRTASDNKTDVLLHKIIKGELKFP